MLVNGWRWGAIAVGAVFALSPTARAGDDTFRLDLRKPAASSTGAGGVGAAGVFSHDARAMPTDDDLEDVHLRYWRGYARGYHGFNYYLPRFYAYRSGYYAGSG